MRNPNAAAAANATSDFSRSPVPKLMLAERSTTTHVCSSRSASVVRICGVSERAVRFQSIQRESSPASYARAPATSVPGPLLAAEELAAQQAVEPARHEELEPAQLGRLARDRRDALGRVGRSAVAHAVSCRPLSCRGESPAASASSRAPAR